MPIIADHHKENHPFATDTFYECVCRWPEDCYVQWGGNGIVLGKKSSYNTAFFEAFPKDVPPVGFIRGEGASIAEAEQDAQAKYRLASECDHQWSRRSYLNGGGICRLCGQFASAFHPVWMPHDLEKPLNAAELSLIGYGFLYNSELKDTAARRNALEIKIRARRQGLELPSYFLLGETEYGRLCREAVDRFLEVRDPARPSSDSSPAEQFFDAAARFDLEGLRHHAKRERNHDENQDLQD